MVLPVGLNIRANEHSAFDNNTITGSSILTSPSSSSTTTTTTSTSSTTATTTASTAIALATTITTTLAATTTTSIPLTTRASYSTASRLNMSSVQIQSVPTTYVDFVIMKDGNRCMVRCSRKAILEHSTELTKLIQTPQITSNYRRGIEQTQFQINNVNPQDFEMLTRFLETKFIRFQDIKHIVAISMLAERFSCLDLYRECIIEMDLLMSVETVLEIYRAMSHFRNLLFGNQNTDGDDPPSERPRSKSSKRKNSKAQKIRLRTPQTTEEYGATLLFNALEFIDMHAEFLLSDNRITSLSYEEFCMVMKRERLQVRSELTVYNCLADWSRAECHRRDLSPSPENRRKMLGPLCFAPHYLCMTIEEFDIACYRVDLLDPTEADLVRKALKGEKLNELKQEQLALLQRFASKRPDFAEMPVYLSDRSDHRNYSREMRLANQEEDSCYKTVGLNCLTVFTCVFD